MANLGTLYSNNQIIPAPMSSAYYPDVSQYPYFKGSGQGPATIPLNYGGSGGTAGASATAAASPFSFTQSPLIISVAALIIGMWGLRYIHWRG